MQLKNYQLYAFNKMLEHDKVFILWYRQSGKTFLLSKYLEYFVNNNKNQNILYFAYKMDYARTIKDKKVMQFINNSYIIKHRRNDISFINDNYIEFCSIENRSIDHTLRTLRPSLIICDELTRESRNLITLSSYIKISSCKCIFAASFILLDVITLLDNNNDFYINIIPLLKDDRLFGFWGPYFFNIKDLSYKPYELLDYDNAIYQRKKKLKKLSEIPNEM